MKRRRFLQLAASIAAAAAVRTIAFASLNHDQEVFLMIRDQMLDAGDAVRVGAGERVRFHFVHAGASEEVHLHLPGHRFTVIALDGNPVPMPAAVEVLSLARGERIEAMVEMNNPGNWTLGSLNDAERAGGLGVRVAYADQNGPAQWHTPKAVDWSYARFSARAVRFRRQIRPSRCCLRKADGSSMANHSRISINCLSTRPSISAAHDECY